MSLTRAGRALLTKIIAQPSRFLARRHGAVLKGLRKRGLVTVERARYQGNQVAVTDKGRALSVRAPISGDSHG